MWGRDKPNFQELGQTTGLVALAKLDRHSPIHLLRIAVEVLVECQVHGLKTMHYTYENGILAPKKRESRFEYVDVDLTAAIEQFVDEVPALADLANNLPMFESGLPQMVVIMATNK